MNAAPDPRPAGPADPALDAELLALRAEALGWQPLGRGAYLHAGAPDEDTPVIDVVGLPSLEHAGLNVLLLG